MPSIKKGESEKDYVARCIPIVMKEKGIDSKEASARCHGMYQQYKKKGTQYDDSLDLACSSFEKVSEDDKEEIHKMTVVIGNRFMKGIFMPKDELRKSYKGFEGTLHDINHRGTGYAVGLTVIPSDVSYVVGYNTDVKFDETTGEVTANVHILKNAQRYNEWKNYEMICKAAGKIPNVSMFIEGKSKAMKASNLPKDVDYSEQMNKYGYKNVVPTMTDIVPKAVSTVFEGACNDKDGCGIRNSVSECNDGTCSVEEPEKIESTDNDKSSKLKEDKKYKEYLKNRLKNIKG